MGLAGIQEDSSITCKTHLGIKCGWSYWYFIPIHAFNIPDNYNFFYWNHYLLYISILWWKMSNLWYHVLYIGSREIWYAS